MQSNKSYLKIAFSLDLSGRDRAIYRALEIFPGALAWLTLFGMVAASYLYPVGAAFFIITFDLYWLIKTVFLSLHLRANAKRMKENLKLDWGERLSKLKWEHLWHLVILPMSREHLAVVEGTIRAILKSPWPKERMIVIFS